MDAFRENDSRMSRAPFSENFLRSLSSDTNFDRVQ